MSGSLVYGDAQAAVQAGVPDDGRVQSPADYDFDCLIVSSLLWSFGVLNGLL